MVYITVDFTMFGYYTMNNENDKIKFDCEIYQGWAIVTMCSPCDDEINLLSDPYPRTIAVFYDKQDAIDMAKKIKKSS